MKAPESSIKAISYPVKILYWNGIPQIRPDGGNEEELYSFISQFKENTKLNITLSEEDINTIERVSYQKGYEQAEKDLGWHSVKESLPPVGEEVIALCNESHGTTLPIACYMCFAHLVEDKTIFVEYNGWNTPGVKYWMPCPELPEK